MTPVRNGGEAMKGAVVARSEWVDEMSVAQRDAVERVICVDPEDRDHGSAGKLDVHRDGRLHRAFSILIYNARKELLLQRRADAKYHFAGYWSNTCCGHPRPGESTPAAAQRRLEEEFGFVAPLGKHIELVYRAEDPATGLIEHEYLHVYRGVFVGSPDPNPDEIGAWRWMTVPAIHRALQRSPHLFTPWFALLVRRVLGDWSDQRSFAGPAIRARRSL